MGREDDGAAKWPRDEVRPDRAVRVPQRASSSGALQGDSAYISAMTTGVSDEEFRQSESKSRLVTESVELPYKIPDSVPVV